MYNSLFSRATVKIMLLLSVIDGLSFAQTWFTQGALHPLQTPSHVILLLSIGLLMGQQPQTGLKSGFVSFIIALLVGYWLNGILSVNWPEILIILSLALIVSLLVILKMNLPRIIILLVTVLGGLLLGFNSTPIIIPGLGDNSIFNWYAGATLSFTGLLIGVILMARLLRPFWDGIILRILGSWIATSAIFVLTLMLAKH